MFIERRVLETADAQLDVKDLPPDIRREIKAHEAKLRGGKLTLAEAKRRTERLMEEMEETQA